jgi:protein-S-isoprenylcysteine O-methyltransferase Ste14
MNTIFLIIADLLMLSFFVMRHVSGRKWKHASKPGSLKEFFAKEFIVLVFITLVVIQHFGFSWKFNVSPYALILTIPASVFGVWLCYRTRKERALTWSRFGIQPSNHKLTTGGPHRFSRHPYYVGISVWAFGISLIYANFLIIFVSIIWIIAAMTVARNEEKFLQAEFGDEWSRYKKRTPFWFGVRSLLP